MAMCGGRANVLARKADEVLGVEIETGASDVVSNVKIDLLFGFSRILVLTANEASTKKRNHASQMPNCLLRTECESRRVESYIGNISNTDLIPLH